MLITAILRRLADEEPTTKAARAELLTAAEDLRDQLDQLVDALTELDEADRAELPDARERLAGRADDVLGELASAGLIAPRLGNGTTTGRELTLRRLSGVAVRAYADATTGDSAAHEAAALTAAVEAVLAGAGYLPPAR